MIIIYHGYVMKALDPSLLPLAVVIPEPGDDAPAAQAPVPSQMSLMTLSDHVAKVAPKVRGHAAMPGTGPKDQTCGSCGSMMRKTSAAKTYTKCSRTQSKWTGGAATDVRLKDPACSKWTRRFQTS